MRTFQPRRTLLLLAVSFLAGARAGSAAVAGSGPLKARILYDNSGSMYPGYAPPGRPGTPRSVSGSRLVHQYPEFQDWLSDFVVRQSLLNAGTASMWALTSHGEFAPGDLKEIHPEVPLAQFDTARAIQGIPEQWGETTYLAEGLSRVSQGFEGLVWLITDSIVDTGSGEPNADVERFFVALRDEPRYRSVHLYKLPFRDRVNGQRSNLAVYGVLVSDAAVPSDVLARYDGRFRSDFRGANRRRGNPPPPLFEGREHLKLKDLAIASLELKTDPSLRAMLENPEGLFKEGRPVQLGLDGRIQSYLTQHSVTGGRYTVKLLGDLEPEEWARRDLGARPLPGALFESASDEIQQVIPPNGAREIRATLRSTEPVALSYRGLGAWLRLAFAGAVVQYSGTAELSFEDVEVRLDRGKLQGVFGVDAASRVFDVQEVRRLQPLPSRAPVRFALRTGSQRTALLLLAVFLAAGLLGFCAVLFARRAWYRIRITGTPDRTVSLRRLASHQVQHEGQVLGRLSRRLLGGHDFAPNQLSAALTITPTRQPDTYDVRFRDGRGVQLAIEPLAKASGKKRSAGPRARTKPAPGPPVVPQTTVRSLPKIDRPRA
jgi:hypothetical protein